MSAAVLSPSFRLYNLRCTVFSVMLYQLARSSKFEKGDINFVFKAAAFCLKNSVLVKNLDPTIRTRYTSSSSPLATTCPKSRKRATTTHHLDISAQLVDVEKSKRNTICPALHPMSPATSGFAVTASGESAADGKRWTSSAASNCVPFKRLQCSL